LHEIEHITQFNGTYEDEISGAVNVPGDMSTLKTRYPSVSADTRTEDLTMGEIDARYAPLNYLREKGMVEVEQFWKDYMAMNTFYDDEHDMTVVLAHFEKTGAILDPDYFVPELASLCAEVRGRVEGDMKPPAITCVLKDMLDNGELDGVQKLKAEHYVEAATRLGLVGVSKLASEVALSVEAGNSPDISASISSP